RVSNPWPNSVGKADLSAPQPWQGWLQPARRPIRGSEPASDWPPPFVLSPTSPSQTFHRYARLSMARRRDAGPKNGTGDRAVRDTRTAESRLRDLRTESSGEWPGNRLCERKQKCIRHKPWERGENSTHSQSQ